MLSFADTILYMYINEIMSEPVKNISLLIAIDNFTKNSKHILQQQPVNKIKYCINSVKL